MPSLEKEIDEPLGAGLKPRAPRRQIIFPRATNLFAFFLALIIIGGSASLALRDKEFREVRPAPAAVTVVPRAFEVDRDETQTKPAETAPRRSPSIIKLDPQAAGESDNSVIIIRDPSAVGQNLRVAHLPDRELLEESAFGPLPKRAEDGRRPFDVYARPWSGNRGARIALVIGGLGLSQTGTQAAIERLPGEVTLAFAPHGNSIDRWMQAARRSGHEILMQIPLEPFDYPRVNPGRNTLTVEAGDEQNLESLLWALGRTTNYTGVMNYMGARFVADHAAFEPVMAELGRRGLLYLDDGTTARTAAPALAPEKGVPLASSDTVIDELRERGEILKKLDELERIANARGFALGTGSAFDITVETVANWVSEVRSRGVEIVPVSALADDPERK